MKALSISQPWAWAILHAGKRIENRDWKPPKWIIGQTIAIHAAKSWDENAAEFIDKASGEILVVPELAKLCPPYRKDHIAGAIVGTCKIHSVIENAEDAPLLQEGWFMGDYGWVLHDVKLLEHPVPCRGALGFWDVPPDVNKKSLEY
jgi:hypothetical protein